MRRRADSNDVREAAPAEDLAFQGYAPPLVVGEAKPPGTMGGAEDTVLLEQVVNDRLLVPVDPAGEEKQEEGERRRQRAHGRSVPHGPSQFKGWSLQYRRPTDQTSVPEAQASTKASTRPFFRRCVLARVFAPDAIPKPSHRHRLLVGHRVATTPILGGLHHEDRLEAA